jgi:uncharacterized membrane protein
MVCSISCSIAAIFLIGMIYMSFSIDKCSLSDRFMDTLSPDQKHKYKRIVNERRMIYLCGYLVGFALSVMYISSMSESDRQNSTSLLCIVAAITFLTSYFFYILFPKSPLMILELDDKNQRKEWIRIYKKMQIHYHIGIVLGLIAVLFFTKGVCS